MPAFRRTRVFPSSANINCASRKHPTCTDIGFTRYRHINARKSETSDLRCSIRATLASIGEKGQSFDDAIEHPLHAEPVRELSEIVAPGLDGERGRYLASTRKSLEQRSRLLAIAHHEDMRRAPHRFGVVIVGGVEENARSLEF